MVRIASRPSIWVYCAMPRSSTRPPSIAEAVAKGWTERLCDACLGTGKRMGAPPLDYVCAANECPSCEGRGRVWVSPAGRICLFPGGQFRPR